MLKKYENHKFTWIDVESPTADEISNLVKEYKIHPLAGSELLSPTVRPKVDPYDHFIYLILHFPTAGHSHNGETEQEIDFIIGKHFLITVHYEPVDALHRFAKVFEMNSLLEREHITEHGGYAFFYMLKELYKEVSDGLIHATAKLKDVEERIFKGEEGRMVVEISSINKLLVDVKESLRFHKEVLESFEAAGKDFFEPKFHYYLRAIQGEYYKVFSLLESQKELLVDLRDTNDSLLTAKSNEIMKTLTVMAFIILPLTLITQVFSMNTRLPVVGKENDFEIIIGGMLTIAALLFLFFKRKKWL